MKFHAPRLEAFIRAHAKKPRNTETSFAQWNQYMTAAKMFASGKKPREVAAAVGCHERTAAGWKAGTCNAYNKAHAKAVK